MTGDQLTEHRLAMLEKFAEGTRQTERQVDLLSAAVARFEAQLAATDASALTRDSHMRESMARLHARLDELDRDEQIEEGARSERARLGRWLIATVAASAGFTSAIVALVSKF